MALCPGPRSIGWLDARINSRGAGLARWAKGSAEIAILPNGASWRFSNLQRDVSGVAVEFDWPRPGDLPKLSELMAWNAQLPVVMFSEYHAEDLAVWAFRSGVADYVVTPITQSDLTSVLQRLNHPSPAVRTYRRAGLRPPDVPAPASKVGAVARTDPATRYIQRNVGVQIMERDLADLCGLSISEFSRAFHRDHGCCFRQFLMRQRVETAASLLSTTTRTVAEIGYDVGFGDPSQFCRHFRRFFESTPSEYRQRCQAPGQAWTCAS